MSSGVNSYKDRVQTVLRSVFLNVFQQILTPTYIRIVLKMYSESVIFMFFQPGLAPTHIRIVSKACSEVCFSMFFNQFWSQLIWFSQTQIGLAQPNVQIVMQKPVRNSFAPTVTPLHIWRCLRIFPNHKYYTRCYFLLVYNDFPNHK